MKNRRYMGWLVAALVACSAIFSGAARKDEVTLVMVPREDAAAQQLGLDIAGKYPTLLIGYKLGADGLASLHGWTGTKWVNITPADFAAGKFFKIPPDSALVVEKENAPVSGKLIPPEAWCSGVSKITTTQLRPLVHLTGQYYDFSAKDWKWFATRYEMDMDAINPEGLNVAWYNRRMAEHLKSSDPQDASNDLRYWVSIRQPVVDEPVEPGSGEEPEVSGNPLTNAVPSAVVLGAPNAPEEAP